MAILIFGLLSSVTPEGDRTRQDELRNGLFSMIAFVLGACTSILSGYVGMRIATYANARTALEARKGIAPAFMTGEWVCCLQMLLAHMLTCTSQLSQLSVPALSWASCWLALAF